MQNRLLIYLKNISLFNSGFTIFPLRKGECTIRKRKEREHRSIAWLLDCYGNGKLTVQWWANTPSQRSRFFLWRHWLNNSLNNYCKIHWKIHWKRQSEKFHWKISWKKKQRRQKKKKEKLEKITLPWRNSPFGTPLCCCHGEVSSLGRSSTKRNDTRRHGNHAMVHVRQFALCTLPIHIYISCDLWRLVRRV